MIKSKIIFFIKQLPIFGLNKNRIVKFFTLSILAAFFESFGIAMFLPVMQYIEKNKDINVLKSTNKIWVWIVSTFHHINVPINLFTLLIAITTLLMLRVIFLYYRKVYSAWLSQTIHHTTRTNLFKQYTRARYSLYDQFTVGQMINLATTETQRFGSSFYSLFLMIASLIMIAGYVFIMLCLSIPLTVMSMLLLTVTGTIIARYTRRTKSLSFSTTEWNNKLSTVLIERLSSLKLLKLADAVEREIKTVKDTSSNVRKENFWLRKLNARIDLLLEPVLVIFTVTLLFTSVSYFKMGLSQIGLFMLIMLRLLPVSKEFMHHRQSYQSCSGSIAAILDVFKKTENTFEVNTGHHKFNGLSKGITFENVTYKYPEQLEPALKNINLFLPAGKMIAIVGPSGAGKSTMIDLIPGLRYPQQGRVLFDSYAVEDHDLSSLRRGMAFVPQDPFMYNDTVLNNILFVHPEADEKKVWKSLAMVHASDFVKNLPEGIHTIIGERGTRLSGGQLQRLALAQAFLKKTHLLILDEPTSALDTEIEMDIKRTIEKLRKNYGTTIIIIAHRLSTIRGADKIVVLSEGKVVEEGTHKALMVSEEWYSKINRLSI